MLAGWIPPAFRRDGMSRRRRKRPRRSRRGRQRALPARSGFVPGIPQGGMDEHIQSIGSSTGSRPKTMLECMYYITVPWAWVCVRSSPARSPPEACGLQRRTRHPARRQGTWASPPSVVATGAVLGFCNPTQDIRQVLRNAIAALIVFGDRASSRWCGTGRPPSPLYNLDDLAHHLPAGRRARAGHRLGSADRPGADRGVRVAGVIHVSLDVPGPG